VREVVRLVQDARKNSGLDVSDRIELWWTVDGSPATPLAEALAEHAETLAAEVLAVRTHPDTAGPGAGIDGPAGSRFWLARAA
jgi:isoleucyl-tRNA synthetase